MLIHNVQKFLTITWIKNILTICQWCYITLGRDKTKAHQWIGTYLSEYTITIPLE